MRIVKCSHTLSDFLLFMSHPCAEHFLYTTHPYVSFHQPPIGRTSPPTTHISPYTSYTSNVCVCVCRRRRPRDLFVCVIVERCVLGCAAQSNGERIVDWAPCGACWPWYARSHTRTHTRGVCNGKVRENERADAECSSFLRCRSMEFSIRVRDGIF